jgi:hypothetical protein
MNLLLLVAVGLTPFGVPPLGGRTFCVLGAAEPEPPPPDWWHQIAPSRHELGLVLGAVGAITFLTLIWAIFIRKPEDERSRRYSYPRVSKSRADADSGSQTAPRKRRRRRRRRHRRNPTLAETGGLPPIRNEGFHGDPP